LFRTSAANFYSYLVAKCCNARDPAGCLWAMRRAIKADPMLLASGRFRRMGLKSLAELVFAKFRGKSGALPATQQEGKTPSAARRQDGPFSSTVL
jgi:hypothetical protein